MGTEMIEWDVVQPEMRIPHRMVVDRGQVGSGGGQRPATLDDLKRACEAVGLHVATQEENTERATQARLLASAHDAACSAFKASETEVATLRAQLAATTAAAKAERANAMGAEEQRDTARAQLAALTPTEGRATDEELFAIYANVDCAADHLKTGIRAVAARVRRERHACLVERLVAKAVDFEVTEEGGGYWTVCTRTSDGQPSYRTTSHAVPAADVPATLARLAGLGEK